MAGGGACVAGGAWPGGHVRQRVHGRGACMVQGCVMGGMHDREGACMAGGHAWWGVCMVGACVAGGVHVMHAPPGRYYGYGIRSMSGRYASYWNAFLSILLLFSCSACIL